MASYFRDELLAYGGCSRMLRTDNGTENVNMKPIQEWFGCTYISGSSTSHQQIE